MAEDYAYACQRAELLGLSPPSEEEWNKSRQASVTTSGRDEDEVEETLAQDLETKDEGLRHVGGGLDELTSILSATQKKLNRFKNVCGSLGTLLKVRVGSRTSTPDHAPLQPNPEITKESQDAVMRDETITVECSAERETESESTARKHNINEKVESHIDKLDLLISKAENAQYSMQHQSKQMRKILK